MITAYFIHNGMCLLVHNVENACVAIPSNVDHVTHKTRVYKP